MLALEQDGTTVGALSFGADAYLAAVDIDGDADLLVDFTPDDEQQQQELRDAIDYLEAELPGVPHTTMLLWRCYLGSNTKVIDGLSELSDGRSARIRVRALRATGLFAARIVYASHKIVGRSATDFTAGRRLRRTELAFEYEAKNCPSVVTTPARATVDGRFVVGGVRHAVVAVHGTMACALPLAAELRQLVRNYPAVLRFEHDTWLPISDNAKQLTEAVTRLELDQVTLVAHSRGGLVARECAARLRKSTQLDVRVITLGTPFEGTPMPL